MGPSLPQKSTRIPAFLAVVIALLVALPCVICWVFFFGRLYGVLGFLIFAVLLPILVWHYQRRKDPARSCDQQIDKSTGKPSDPRQMANFVP